MKSKTLPLLSLAVVWAALPGAGPAVLYADTAAVEPVPDRKATARGEATGHVLKASDLIGKKVERSGKKAAGKVEDIIVGLETGRIAAVLIALEDGTLRAVPPGVLHYDTIGKTLHLKAELPKVEKSMVLERPSWKQTLTGETLGKLYRQFDIEAFFATPGAEAQDTLPPLGALEMATKLDGAPVMTASGDNAGQVHNSMVDLGTGHIPFVIVATGSYTGKDGMLTPVPVQALSYDTKREVLVFDTDKDRLVRMPSFTTAKWADMNDGAYTASIYAAYGLDVKEATTPAADAEAETAKTGNAKAEREGPLNPLDQSNDKDDVKLSAAIRKEIVAQKDLTVKAKNVQIITRDGQVTLRGTVKSSGEKKVISGIAMKQAGEDRVIDRLKVED